MMMSRLLASCLLLSVGGLPSALVEAIQGKGPVGVHPINERYIAVADSSIDSILIVDATAGGSVVGHFVLHDRKNDPSDADAHVGGKTDLDGWVNPLGLSTCDECDNLFVTSPDKLYRIKLERPLLEMAEAHDFSSLADTSRIHDFWPDNWNTKFRGDGKLRMVSVAPDGSSAYVTHRKGGVFSFDPTLASIGDDSARHAIHIGDAGIDEMEISGIHHTRSLSHLVITSGHHVHIVNIIDNEGYNPLDIGDVTAYKLALEVHCEHLYDGEKMHFFDTVIVNEYAFVLGHPQESSHTNGVAIYRLTWDQKEEDWYNCISVAGKGAEEAGWQDGYGSDALFSQSAHNLAYLPSTSRHALVLGDVDNRALRYVDATTPIETGDDSEPTRVTSVNYDEDLWYVLYRDGNKPEDVMKDDGKSYFQSGEDAMYSMNFSKAEDECRRVGTGRVCTLPEIRARFARGQYPTMDAEDDSAWTTVWTDESCGGCHLERPGTCAIAGGWGNDNKMVANFSAKFGLVTQCTEASEPTGAMSMCCGLGGPKLVDPLEIVDTTGGTGSAANTKVGASSASAKGAEEIADEEEGPSATVRVVMGVMVSLVVVVIVGAAVFMRKRAKPNWFPSFMRKDRRETDHAPHREVDLRGRDYI